MDEGRCPFCALPAERILLENEVALAIRDAFPVSAGHVLILPRRHAGSFFELGGDERRGMLSLLDRVKELLDAEHRPDGYNIGINDGAAAGQTVAHSHIHVIPRYQGDQQDPRGGIRWIIPERAAYWNR